MNQLHLDTSSFSLLMREHPPFVARLRELPAESRLGISAVVRGEIVFGIARLSAGARRDRLERRADELFAVVASIPVGDAAADRYGAIKRATELRGLRTSDNDLWIAAVALAGGATLITADSDFSRVPELRTEDWSR